MLYFHFGGSFFFWNIPKKQKKVGFSQQGNKQEVHYSMCEKKKDLELFCRSKTIRLLRVAAVVTR